jgi:hypothetical protein|tara:strand:- start:10034 stop:10357 length:324 start_codon:yes stop_codon:yes gene_type:complete
MDQLIIKQFVKIFLSYGLLHMILNIAIPAAYLKLLLFVTLKILFDYTKCTFSYLEIKLRGVKKEEGYLYNLLTSLNELRYDRDFLILLFIINTFLFYNFIQNNFSFI